MMSNTTRELINLAISNLESENPTQEIINEATNYLKDAILQIKKEKEEIKEEPQEYKVILVHPYTYTDKIINTFPHAGTGRIEGQIKYCSTQYIDIEGYKYLILHQNLAYHRGNFYDKDKNFIKGYTERNYKSGEIMEIPEGAKYFVGGSASNGELPLIYGYTYNKPSPIIFTHESNKEYTVTNISELKQGNYKTGDVVITKGYSLEGDLGNGIYDIMTEAEYIHLMKKSAFIPKVTTQVDGYGNHILNNGLVARLRIDNDDMRPEQWGAKGDGVTNDCQALTHMFAKITSGTITFKQDATYLLGLYGGDVSNPTDNPYRTFACGELLGGQYFSKPILTGAHNLVLNGNNCLITIPDNIFGKVGMGILNFSGYLEYVEIYGFNFDGKGRTINYPNKNSNHILFYSPISIGKTETIKSIHPVYTNNEKKGSIKNLSIHDNYFYDAGAMYRQAGDWGGDHILIINPDEVDGIDINHNKFEAWGRWVLAIDLGGNGECLKNIKFNNNICIGANAYEEVNEDGSYKFLIDLDKKEFLKLNSKFNEAGLDRQLDLWRWRALGFIDFESRKCFDNVELIGNTIIGTGGWAINGNSRINQNFLIKDNYWSHVGGGYPYFFELYSGIGKNIVVENNDFPTRCGFKTGYFTDGVTFRNNRGLNGIRTFGLCGDIIIENNRSIEEKPSRTTVLWSHESNNYEADPQYTLDKVKERGVNIIVKNNDYAITAKFTDLDNIEKTSFFNYDFEFDKPIQRANIIEFNNDIVLDPTNIEFAGQGIIFKGCRISKPFTDRNMCGNLFYVEEGQTTAIPNNTWGVVSGDFYKNKLVEDDFSKYNNYNWGVYMQWNNIASLSIVCTESGLMPGNCEYGFRDQCTHISYILNNNLKLQDNAYVSTDDDIYWTKDGGKLTQIPNHKEGMQTYTDEEGNSIDLYYIGKVGKFKLICE